MTSVIECRVFSREVRDDSNRKIKLTLEEDLQYTSCLFVDQTGNTLYTTSSGQTTNSGFRDTCEGSVRMVL